MNLHFPKWTSSNGTKMEGLKPMTSEGNADASVPASKTITKPKEEYQLPWEDGQRPWSIITKDEEK